MKKNLLLLFPLLLSWQTEDMTLITGKVQLPEDSQLEILSFQGCDTTLHVKPEIDGTFFLRFPTRQIPFFSLNGKVLMDGQNKWQFANPVYVAPNGETHIELELANYQAKVSCKDDNNQAIQESYDHFYHSRQASYVYTPKPSELKGAATKHLETIQRICKTHQTCPIVTEYLTTWSQLEYIHMVNSAKKAYKRSKVELPANIMEGIPSIEKVMNKPYWMMYESASFIIGDYVQAQAKSAEDQLAFVRKNFTVPSIIQDQIRRVVSTFLFAHPYSDDNMKRLSALSEDMEGRDYILNSYYEKRYSAVGAETPDVEFEDLKGNNHKLSEFKGKYIYIDLWATWCGPCQKEIPHLKKLHEELKNDQVIIVSISVDKDRKKWEEKLKEDNLGGIQWICKDNTIGRMLSIPGVPYFLIYDKEGKLLEYRAPRASNPQTKAKLESLK